MNLVLVPYLLAWEWGEGFLRPILRCSQANPIQSGSTLYYPFNISPNVFKAWLCTSWWCASVHECWVLIWIFGETCHVVLKNYMTDLPCHLTLLFVSWKEAYLIERYPKSILRVMLARRKHAHFVQDFFAFDINNTKRNILWTMCMYFFERVNNSNTLLRCRFSG